MPASQGPIQEESAGGVSREHDPVAPIRFLVGPSTSSEFNTLRLRLIPIACWGVDDIRFAFDSSFVDADPDDSDNPNDIRAELAHLIKLIQAHPDCPLTVFGHADPVGTDDYNKLLSGRRAAAIYSVLIARGDSAAAVKLWQDVAATEKWGTLQQTRMQDFTGLPAGTSVGTLIQSYLTKLCPPELVLTSANFLARGADAASKGDYQGCSEFNPIILFSKETQDQFDQAHAGAGTSEDEMIALRNMANAPNRRVMVLMFRKGSQVDPKKWPCPSAKEGIAGCKLRFWSDGETRRSAHASGADRLFPITHDTFGCRFYQRITDNSPCEKLFAPDVSGAHGFSTGPYDAPQTSSSSA